MAIEVFSRYELKFMLNQAQYDCVIREIESRMACDSYSADGKFYTISNIYYDTPDNFLISTAVKHDGKYRYKVRLRTYDPESDIAFLEIKKKFNGLTSKRRTRIYIDDVNPMFESGIFPEIHRFMNKQVTKELYQVGRAHPLVPKTVVSYDRRAFFGADEEDGDLRITFDSSIRTRRTDLDLRKGSFGTLLTEPDIYIMEVKVDRSVPLWVARLLSENGVHRIKFSKYGTEYKNFIKNGGNEIERTARNY